MVLRAIHDALHTSKSDVTVIQEKLSVEHILPQTWQEHWPLPEGVAVEEATEVREDLVHDFGNLTVLMQALNSSVSNGPAAAKLPKIALQSELRLNTEFQGRTTWTEEDIRARSRKLFAVAKQVWPRPGRA